MERVFFIYVFTIYGVWMRDVAGGAGTGRQRNDCADADRLFYDRALMVISPRQFITL